MDPWTIGLVVVVVLGLAAITYGALADRRRNRRAAAEMLAPPDRVIPHFAPSTPAPQYLSELQARRRPPGRSSDLTAEERSAISGRLADPAVPRVPVGMVSDDFVTDQVTGWAVLDAPYVLVCADPVSTIRELVGVLEKVMPTGRPVVVVAPSLSPEVRRTLEVNAIQGSLGLVAVEAADADRDRLAELSGATPVPRDDLQSGYLTLDRLGSCDRWVSSRHSSHLLPADPGPALGNGSGQL